MRVVMWSGPRNLSTAMMRSFGNRADTDVVDEPFYAAYLALTGTQHPMREEILAAHEPDWRKVAESCAAPAPAGRIRYEKHMTHHMVAPILLDWMSGAAVAFLIRNPREVAASYAAKRADFTPADLGIERQAALFDATTAMLGYCPPVVDAADIRRAPARTLAKLCRALGLAFDTAMLAWPPGPRATDGVWAAHWYAAVNASTGFTPHDAPAPTLDPALERLVAPLMPHYDRLAQHAL
ncbi:MAG: HAD family hydrolase [Pseudomonadota bacterium]